MSRRGHRPSQPAHGRPRLWGRHAVLAALANPERTVRKLWGTRDALTRLDLPPVIPVTYCDVADLGRLVPSDAPHQGLVAEVDPLEDIWLGDLLEQNAEGTQPLVVLDQVTDPHNVGAIMRSAVAFNAGAVITTMRHSPTESGVLAKSASGALELIPYIQVTNLADALGELHKLGFFSVGLDSEGPAPIEQTFSGEKIALILGAEGKGLRQKTRETVSALARLDMPGEIKSLNVSNAAAIALYATQQFLGKASS